jgi:hypothetical protein
MRPLAAGRAGVSPQTQFDLICDPPWEYTPDAPSGDGGGGTIQYYICWFWVLYDQNGDVYSATLLYCEEEL